MGNQHPSFNCDNDAFHGEQSMDYINRFFARRSPVRSQPRPHTSRPIRAPANSPRRHHSDSGQHRYHKQKHHRQKMTPFSGPWSQNLDAFKKSVESMPEKYQSSFAGTSKSTLQKICDPDVLHVWESDSDVDNLLQLTSVIAKLCDLGVRKERGANSKDGSMLIIAEEKSGRNNYARICQLVEYLICADGKNHLDGTVCVFSKIVVVRGWDNSKSPTGTGNKEASEKVVKRINIALERVLNKGNFDGDKRKVVWHHGPVIHFLLHWISTTTSTLRSSLSAITVTGSLDLKSGVAPSTAGRANKLPDLERLEQYAKKLGNPVVFLDSPSQLITFDYLGTYMYFYAYYINTFLPTSLLQPHLHKAQDELVTFAFRLRAASDSTYGSNTVKMVQKHLDASKAKRWARMCVSSTSYEKSACRAAGRDAPIHHAVQLADAPFALLNHGNAVPAFARLSVGPAAAGSAECFVAAPVSINFSQGQLRPSSPTPFHILIPEKSQDLEKITNRIQGLMMAVLERVRQERGSPVLHNDERETWKAVVKACTWAVDGCAGKMPESVGEKVKYVMQKLREGTWGYALGAPQDGGGNGGNVGVAPMPEPNKFYGFGQPGAQQVVGGYGQQGMAMLQQQQPFPNQGYTQQGLPQGVQMQTGMGMGTGAGAGFDPAMYAQVQGQAFPQSAGYGQQAGGGYPPAQQVGGGGYPQNMGGPWS